MKSNRMAELRVMTPGRLQARIARPKRVRNPLYGHVTAAGNSNHIKAHCRRTKAAVPGNKKRGCADELPLLALVHGMARLGESIRAAAANFNKCEALSVHHDQVNFTAAGTEIPGDWRETVTQQVLERRLFGALA